MSGSAAGPASSGSLRSMTGYGRVDGEFYSVSLSTVNRKGLDIALQLPKALAPLESRVHECLRGRLARGRVSGAVVPTAASEQGGWIVDAGAAEAMVGQLRGAAERLGLPDDLSASLLANLPNVVRAEENGVALDQAWDRLRPELERCLQQVVAMREAEGGRLLEDLRPRLQHLDRICEGVESLAEDAAGRRREQLRERLESAGLPVDLDDERLVKEVALFAERADITEELIRIRSHLAQMRDAFGCSDPVGRSLDFLCQELQREINTIGSKASDADISSRVIQFKAELERVREQVQNIE